MYEWWAFLRSASVCSVYFFFAKNLMLQEIYKKIYPKLDIKIIILRIFYNLLYFDYYILSILQSYCKSFVITI